MKPLKKNSGYIPEGSLDRGKLGTWYKNKKI